MKWSVITILFILLMIPSAVADRPEYLFSDEVFKELEPFPDDFFEIRNLFATQSITAKQLAMSYYQPELIPGWDYWCDRVYISDSDTFGSYGVFMYPSHFTAHDIQDGDFFNVSTFIHTSWGVQKYQGVKLNWSSPQGVNLNIVTPNDNNVLLYPTAPYFHSGWIQLIEISIYVSEANNCTIKIYEGLPDEQYESLWGDQYDNYISGGSLISQRVAKCTIDLFQKPDKSQTQGNNELDKIVPSSNFIYLFVLAMIIISIICLKVMHGKRKPKDEKRP